MACAVHCLGRVEYGLAWRLQKEMAALRASGEIDDALLLLEHPPTITVGKSGRLENVLVPVEDVICALESNFAEVLAVPLRRSSLPVGKLIPLYSSGRS